jgi:hypothetical protein
MRYVDAGYAVALVTLGAYAVSLLARRRRWERAYETSADPSSYSDSGLDAGSCRADSHAIHADSDANDAGSHASDAGSYDAGSHDAGPALPRRERS